MTTIALYFAGGFIVLIFYILLRCNQDEKVRKKNKQIKTEITI